MKASFKDRLNMAMEMREMKASDLCEKCNIPKSAMSYYTGGRSEPKSPRLYLIAKALDVSEAWLLGYDVEMDRPAKQKELDALASVAERMKNEKEFRELIIKINTLNSAQLDAVKSVVAEFPQQ